VRFIKELHRRYENQPIWIVGSDPSLRDYPDDFLEGKVGITLHLAHTKFPKATLRYANEYDRVEFLLREDNGFFSQDCVFAWPFYGHTRAESRDLIKEMPNVYHLRWILYPPRGIREYVSWSYTRRKVRQALDGRSVTYGGHGTCLHGAIYVALMLGCNPINLIGCGHGRVAPAQEHFASMNDVDQGMRPGIRSFADPIRNVPMIEQTLALIDGCRREGVQVNWIKGYAGGALEPMSVDRAELSTLKRSFKKPSLERRVKNMIKTITLPVINWFR
jgi:hypothetical protein